MARAPRSAPLAVALALSALGCADGAHIGGDTPTIAAIDAHGATADPAGIALAADEPSTFVVSGFASGDHELRLSGEEVGKLEVAHVDDRRCASGSASLGPYCVGLGGGTKVGDAWVTLTPLRAGDATLEVVSASGHVLASASLHVRSVARIGLEPARFADRPGAPEVRTFVSGGRVVAVIETDEAVDVHVAPRSFDDLPFFLRVPPRDVPLPEAIAGEWRGEHLVARRVGAASFDGTIHVGDARLRLLPRQTSGFEPSTGGGTPSPTR